MEVYTASQSQFTLFYLEDKVNLNGLHTHKRRRKRAEIAGPWDEQRPIRQGKKDAGK